MPRNQIQQRVEAALAFARELGPFSWNYIFRQVEVSRIETLLGGDTQPSDVVLSLIHEEIRDSGRLNPEFIQHFRPELKGIIARELKGSGARVHLSTESDLEQDVLMAIWTERGRFKFRSKPEFLSWVKKRVAFIANDLRRKQYAEKRSTDRQQSLGTEPQLPAAGPSPLSVESQREELELACEQIHLLPNKERVALRYHMHGLSASQIASIMGCSDRTVHNHIANGRAKLGFKTRGVHQ